MKAVLLALALGPAVLLTAGAAGQAPTRGADAPAGVTLRVQRVVDGRGNRVVDLFRAERVAPDERRVAWFVHGLVRDDLVVRSVRRAGEDGRFGEAARYEVALAGRTPVVFERPGGAGRVTAGAGEETSRFFEEDLGTKTVRCAMKRLAEAADP
ncbi:hypothetical protein FBQ97_03935, partial [Acidobacteria bacterium ACD]|nr:hypothetical protein [Acidobacteria bacterium ACD]